jgi:hypothetical protein|tara:strand:+ start:40714 stop:40911 length:198 start_codon:yes stop_codon:yes gene_type:complete
VIIHALNLDLGGAARHDYAPKFKEFIASISGQLKAGSNELTFGLRAEINANFVPIKAAFSKINTR